MYSITVFLFAVSYFANVFAFTEVPFIFGGEKADENQFPFIVSLRLKDQDKLSHDCGASILSDRILITAAHCFSRISDYRVAIGAHAKTDLGKLYKVKKFVVHPIFNKRELKNDVALIVLEKPIQFNENVSAIEINREFVEAGQPAIVAGWGITNDEYTSLKFAHMKTITNDECREKISSAPINDFGTLCAYSGRNGTGICNGDSGGPLISNNKLIGIASWAKPCGRGVPDGFTRISEYSKWIDQVMEDESVSN